VALTIAPIGGEVKTKGSQVTWTRFTPKSDIAVTAPARHTALPVQRPSEVVIYTPPATPAATVGATPNIYRHFWQIFVMDKNGNVVDIPQSDVVDVEIKDVLNGGSAQGSITFRRPYDNIGPIAYMNRVFIWVWPWYINRPADPYWAGQMVDIDATRLRTDGEIKVTIEGDSRLLSAAVLKETVYPGVGPNPSLDASTYVQHLWSTYAPPNWGTLIIPPSLFSLLPLQLYNVKLDAAIDTVLKSGRDSSGNLITWRTKSLGLSKARQLVVLPDQNPNVFTNLRFKTVLRDGMASSYEIATKYRDIVNNVYIEGGKDPNTGQTVTGYIVDPVSTSAYGVWQDAISVPALQSAGALPQYGTTYTALHGYPQAQGTIVLNDPDPGIMAGTWVQFVEAVGVVKQMRISTSTIKIKRTRIEQTLETVSPTPFLDEAIYRMGQASTRAAGAAAAGLGVNTQQNFIRTGAVITAGP
jgi:hypothetical protein